MKCPVGKKRSCSLQLLPPRSRALRSTAELSEGGQGLAVPAWPSSRGRGCSAPQETSASPHTPQCKPCRPCSSSLQSCAGDGAAREQRVFWGKVSCAHSECLYRGPSALAWLVLAQVFEAAGRSAPSRDRSRAPLHCTPHCWMSEQSSQQQAPEPPLS